MFSSTEVKMVKCQKQEGGVDCGLFAIVNATAIAHNADPVELHYNQSLMRNSFKVF